MRHRRLFASLTRQPRPRGGIYEEDGRGAEALNGRISPAGSSRGVLPSQSRTRRIAPSAQGSGHPVPGLEIDALTCAHHDRARQTGSTLPAPRTALPAPRTEASGRGPEAGLLTALGDLTERCPACLGASSSVECRTAEFSRSFRSRRRPVQQHTAHVRRGAVFLVPIVQLTAAASMATLRAVARDRLRRPLTLRPLTRIRRLRGRWEENRRPIALLDVFTWK